MERSTNNGSMGLLAVCAVSWSVALLAVQAHKRLLSDFMKKIDSELHGRETYESCKTIKKVRFAEDVLEPSTDNKEYRRSRGRIRKDLGGGRRYSWSPDGIDDGRSVGDLESGNGDRHGLVPVDSTSCAYDGSMPLNRQVLYRGIIGDRMIKSHSLPRHFN